MNIDNSNENIDSKSDESEIGIKSSENSITELETMSIGEDSTNFDNLFESIIRYMSDTCVNVNIDKKRQEHEISIKIDPIKLNRYTNSLEQIIDIFDQNKSQIAQLKQENSLLQNENKEKSDLMESNSKKMKDISKSYTTMQERYAMMDSSLKQTSNETKIARKELSYSMQKLKDIQSQRDTMYKYWQKAYELMDLPSDMELEECIKIMENHEKERKHIFSAVKKMNNDIRIMYDQKTQLLSKLEKSEKEISCLKSELDDQRMHVFAKEQQNIALQRQLCKSNFADKVINELINSIQLYMENYYHIESSITLLRLNIISEKDKIAQITDHNNDLALQNELLHSLNSDISEKLKKFNVDRSFLINSFNDHIHNSYMSVIHIKASTENSSPKALNSSKPIGDLMEEIKTLKSNLLNTNNRNQSIVKDFKQQIAKFKCTKGKDSNHILFMEIDSLRDDVRELTKDLQDKNKLIYKLINMYAIRKSDDLNTDRIENSTLDKLMQYMPSYSLQERIDQLTDTLEEVLTKNILLKENVATLGKEIERLNCEVASGKINF